MRVRALSCCLPLAKAACTARNSCPPRAHGNRLLSPSCLVTVAPRTISAPATSAARRRASSSRKRDRPAPKNGSSSVVDAWGHASWMREVYLPAHNARFAKPAAVSEKAFVAANGEVLRETLCSEEQRVVGRDNTVSYEGLKLQLPESRVRAHYVKARVKVREYPNGNLAVLHGPRCLCRYDQEGCQIAAPTRQSLAPCSTPSRRGLETPASVARSVRRPALTAS